MKNKQNKNSEDIPEVLAIIPLPTVEERRRREIMLARVMLVAIDIVLAGDPLGLETARDLVREIKHTCPEMVAGWPRIESVRASRAHETRGILRSRRGMTNFVTPSLFEVKRPSVIPLSSLLIVFFASVVFPSRAEVLS